MTKRLESKYKINCRLEFNLWGRPKSPINVRDYGPGQHGMYRGKPSDYGIQLLAKQKLREYYGTLTERQFRKLYQEIVRRKGDMGENLISLLKRRLDDVVYRMKFASTVFASRQTVNHSHILVNGSRVTIPSFQVKDGDVIEVSKKAREMTTILEAQQSTERDIPDYLTVDSKALKGTFVKVPQLFDFPYPIQMEPNLVIEFYSR